MTAPLDASLASATIWIWNRAFFASCDVHPSARSPTGDAVIHNDASLHADDYAALCEEPLRGDSQPSEASSSTLIDASSSPRTAAPLPLCVYVGTCALPAFVRDVLPRARRPFVLATGMSDPGPARVLGSPTAAHALAEHPLLLAWFAEMRDFLPCAAACATCDKVRALPLGLDLHTLAFRAEDRPQWGPSASPLEQAAAFMSAAAAAAAADAAGRERRSSVYVHFGWWPRERRAVLKLLRAHPLFHFESERHLERGELWARMAGHRWVLCLQGGGPDCHRTWEALGLGCGVICEELPLLRELLGGGGVAGGGAAGGAPLGGVTAVVGGTRVRFRPDWPMAAVFAPAATDLSSADLPARALAREGWREGVLSAARLEAEWQRVAMARRAVKEAGAEAPPVLHLPALLSSEAWLQRMRAVRG